MISIARRHLPRPKKFILAKTTICPVFSPGCLAVKTSALVFLVSHPTPQRYGCPLYGAVSDFLNLGPGCVRVFRGRARHIIVPEHPRRSRDPPITKSHPHLLANRRTRPSSFQRPPVLLAGVVSLLCRVPASQTCSVLPKLGSAELPHRSRPRFCPRKPHSANSIASNTNPTHI